MKKRLIAYGQAVEYADESLSKDKHLYVRLAIYAVVVIVSVIIPQTTVYGGLSPFGVSVAACVEGPACILVCIGTSIGYLIADTVISPMRYLVSLICVVGFQWAFGGAEKLTKHPLFAPLLAAGSTFVTGMALSSINGFEWDIALVEACESILAGGFAFFFKTTLSVVKDNHGPRSFDLQQQASVSITAAVILAALNTVTISDISVGRVLTMIVIMLAARAGQQHGGTLAGVVFGAITAFCSPTYTHLAAGYSFGGLAAGLFSRFGRAVVATLFVLVNMLVALSVGEMDVMLISLYEVFAAAVIFLVLPQIVERAANQIFSRAEALPAAEGVCRSVDMRLQHSADTMRSIAKTVDEVSEKLAAMNTPDLKEVYGGVCERVCNGCKRREICWKREFTDTMAVFRQIGETLRTNGVIHKEDIATEFQRDCHHLSQVLATLNSGYTRFVIKENAFRRLCDIRSIVTDQFEGMASLLSEISDDLHVYQRVDLETASRVENVCEKYRLSVKQSLCMIGHRNRMTVEILVEGGSIPAEDSRFHKELCDACGCELAPPSISYGDGMTKIRLSEKPKLVVHFAGAQLNCHREKLCGDAYETFYDHEGRCCVVLSDGMGTGGRAAVDGAMTAALAAHMLQAGFRFENILRIINSALIVKSGDESLSTLDVMRIDLMSGHISGMKAGAAPGFVCSNGRITTIDAGSLPIGILRDVDVCEFDDYVKSGDVIVMVSDGVASEDTSWLEELIVKLCKEDADERTIANEIVFFARERQGTDHTDDTTALVMKVS